MSNFLTILKISSTGSPFFNGSYYVIQGCKVQSRKQWTIVAQDILMAATPEELASKIVQVVRRDDLVHQFQNKVNILLDIEAGLDPAMLRKADFQAPILMGAGGVVSIDPERKAQVERLARLYFRYDYGQGELLPRKKAEDAMHDLAVETALEWSEKSKL